MLHESTVYFERCHAAELRDDVSLETKSACWDRWLTWYSASQTETRILYARERIVLLSAGELVDPLPIGTAEIPTEETDASSTSGSGDSAPSARSPSNYLPSPRRTGHSVCEPVCRPAFDRCAARCDGMEQTCLGACQTEYSACMSGCI